MVIDIPKGFFEKKSSVTPAELLEMVTDFVHLTERLKEDHDYERENHYELRLENKQLKERIKELETEFKRLGLDGAL